MSINTLGMIQAAASLTNGNGVFCGDPLFLMPDGSFVNKDGVEVYKASSLGLNAYNSFVGFMPANTVIPYQMLPFISEVDSVKSALPTLYVDDDLWVKEGAAEIYKALSSAWVKITTNKVVEATTAPAIYAVGDFWIKQNADADELFVQTAYAWVASTATFSEAATAPETPTDGDYYYDTATSKLMKYVTDAWVEVTDHAYVRAASAPVICVDGDYFLDTDTSDKLYKVVDGAWVEQTTMQHVQASTAPEFYDDGYVVGDQATKKIYTKDTTWGDGVALAAGKLYTDGTDLYVFGSGSLAKI